MDVSDCSGAPLSGNVEPCLVHLVDRASSGAQLGKAAIGAAAAKVGNA